MKIRINMNLIGHCGRRCGLMDSVLDSESGDPGSNAGQDTALCSWETHNVSLHGQV